MNVKVNTPEIFKVQVSLNHNKPMLYIYNRARNIAHEFPATDALIDYVREDKEHEGLKTYVWAFIEDGLFVISHRVSNPGW